MIKSVLTYFSFLAQKSLATSQSFNADGGQNYASIEDHPLSYRKGSDQQYQDNRNSRYSPVYKKRALDNQNTRNQPFKLVFLGLIKGVLFMNE